MTAGLIGAIIGAYLAQGVLAVRLGTTRPVATEYLFLEYPLLAWAAGGLLHHDLLHLGGNLLAVGFLGRVLEPECSTRGYLGFLLGAAAASGVGAYAFQAPFTALPVAAYGASGLAFALGGYALGLPVRASATPRDLDALVAELTAAEGLAVLAGVSVLAAVVADLATGPYLSPAWVNGAHLGGVAFGAAVAAARSAGSRRRRGSGVDRSS